MMCYFGDNMYPLAHLEGQLRQHRKRRINCHLANVSGFIVLLLVSVIIAPLLHEFLHMLFLDINHKPYNAHIAFDWENGITGKITPFTELSINNSIILLGIGIFTNLMLSALFFGVSWMIKNRGRMPESIFSTYLAVGFFYNPCIYFFMTKGDLVNILSLMNLQDFIYLLQVTGFILMVLVSIYIHKHAEDILGRYHKIGEEINKIECFLGKSKSA